MVTILKTYFVKTRPIIYLQVKKREMKDEMRDNMTIKLDYNIPVIYKSKRNDDLQKSIKADPTYGGKTVKETN